MGNLLLYLCVIILSSDICYDVYASEYDSSKVLLRRLRQVVESSTKNDTRLSAVWNDVVAKELVARVISSPHKKDPDEVSSEENNRSRIVNELTSCLSGILLWYKNNVYDVFFGRSADGASESEAETITNPKEEVEIIEPRYHGRICEEEGCKEASPAECPEGETRNSEGICVNSRMILRIPSRCPIGYRMDKSGYCRQLW